jgi:hypothetical protein
MRMQFWLLLGTVVCALSGCEPRSDRLAVSGKITLDDMPLSGASIRFTSIGERKIATGAMVENGEYHIPQEKGLPPGTYHLEIYAPDNDAPPIMMRNTPGGPGIPTAPERIPAEYNVDSDKTIEVTPEGDNEFNFEITTRP